MLPRCAAQVVLRRGGLALRDLATDERPALADFPGPGPEEAPAGGREGAVGPVAELLGDLRQRQLPVGDPGQDDAVAGDTPCIYTRSTHAECYPLVYAPPMLARLLLALAAAASCTSDPSDPALGSSESGSSESGADAAASTGSSSSGATESGDSTTGPAPQPADGPWSECLDAAGEPLQGKCDLGACVDDDVNGFCSPPCNDDNSCPPGPGGQVAWCLETAEARPKPGDLGVYCFIECFAAGDCPTGMVCTPLTVLISFNDEIPEATSFCL